MDAERWRMQGMPACWGLFDLWTRELAGMARFLPRRLVGGHDLKRPSDRNPPESIEQCTQALKGYHKFGIVHAFN